MKRFQLAGALWWVPTALAMELAFSFLSGYLGLHDLGRQAVGWIIFLLILFIVGLVVFLMALAIRRAFSEGRQPPPNWPFFAQAIVIASAPLILIAVLVAVIPELDWDDGEPMLFYVAHIFFLYSFPMSMLAYHRANRRVGNQEVSHVIALRVSLAAALIWEVTVWFGIAPWAL